MLSRELCLEDRKVNELTWDDSNEAASIIQVVKKGWLIICSSLFFSILFSFLYSKTLPKEWVSKAVITETSAQSIRVLIEGFEIIADHGTTNLSSDLFEDVLTQISLTIQTGNTFIKANAVPRGPKNVVELSFTSNSSEGSKQGLMNYLDDLDKLIILNQLSYLSSLKDAKLRKIENKLSFYGKLRSDNSEYLKLLSEKLSISSLNLDTQEVSAFSIYHLSSPYDKTANREKLILALGGFLGLLLGYLIASFKFLGSKNLK